MTIFIQVVKEVILPRLEKYIKDCDDANKAAFADKRRDIELSNVKLMQCRQIRKTVKAYTGKASDDLSRQDLIDSIQKHVEIVDTARNKAKYTEANFEKTIKEVIALIDALYNGLKKENLLNQPYDNDPFNIFCYHIAQYFTKKIADNLKVPGFFGRFWLNPVISNSVELANKKKELVDSSLKDCIKALKGVDSSKDNGAAKLIIVKQTIENLMSKNQAVCQSYSTSLPIAVKLGGIIPAGEASVPAIQYAPGDLEKYLQDALQKIYELEAEALISENASIDAAGEGSKIIKQKKNKKVSTGEPVVLKSSLNRKRADDAELFHDKNYDTNEKLEESEEEQETASYSV